MRKYFTMHSACVIAVAIIYMLGMTVLAGVAGVIYLTLAGHATTSIATVFWSGWFMLGGVKLVFDSLDSSAEFGTKIFDDIAKFKEQNS